MRSDVSLTTRAPASAQRARALSPSHRRELIVWITFAVMGVYLAGLLVALIVTPPDDTSPLFSDWTVAGFEILGSALCLARGFARRPVRAVALTLGVGLLMWAVGDLVTAIESRGGAEPPTPSLADVFFLAFFPFTYVAVVIFVRGELRRLATPSWLDGAVAGVGSAALCAAFVFPSVLHLAGGTPAEAVTNLAYPIADLLLLSLIVGGSTVMSGQRKMPWILMAVGNAVNLVGDTANLFQASLGHLGYSLDAIAWPISILVLSMSVWLRRRPTDPFAVQKQGTFVIPGLSAAFALIILSVGTVRSVSRIGEALAIATLVLVGIRLVLSVRAMRALSQERQHQSLTDELTGLGNRRCLSRVLDAFFAEYDATAGDPRSLAFLFVDLDHFKEVNDTFGHPAGDELLKQLGPRLSGCLREGDLLIRLGGDEFVVLLVDGDADYAAAVAQRLTDGLAMPFAVGTMKVSISASIGIALAPNDAIDGASLLWCADIAMYRAKLGGVPFETYQLDIDKIGNRVLLLDELRTAIDEHQLVLYYQPQLDLRTGEIVAVESLLRWVHPELGVIPPLDFLPFAEEAGLMDAITKLVLTDAIAQCAAWRHEGNFRTVSVNISATNLLDPLFTDLVAELLTLHDVPAEALVLELTETSVISDFDRSQRVIQGLWDLGITVSIDDFGAGFTSLAHLSSLAVKELKLDRTFITGLTAKDCGRDLDLVRATINLGHALGLRIVAEGIEDQATLKLLSDLGCDLGQGYLISIPKPATHLTLAPGVPDSAASALVRT
jgi:diguanylate cyclase (GGDEF)-like protein